MGISCAVLVLLYAFQRLGTSILGHLFAPIILLWFLAIFCVGVFNIATWNPGARVAPATCTEVLIGPSQTCSSWHATFQSGRSPSRCCLCIAGGHIRTLLYCS